MSDLFTEAVRDAEKLREIAEQDAKNKLIEELTPYIRQVIAKEATGASDFFFEQEDEEIDPEAQQQDQQQPAQQQAQQPADPQGMGGQQPTTAPEQTTDTTQTVAPGLGNQPASPGEAPVPSPEGETQVGAQMPDEDGKITVDFEDLFVNADADTVTINPPGQEETAEGGPQAPVQATGDEQVQGDATPPAPEAPGSEEQPTQQSQQTQQQTPEEEEEGLELELPKEAVTFKEYQKVLGNISEKVDRAYFTGRISDLSRETYKQRLMQLLEAVDSLRDRGLLNERQARRNENKLEFLFLKLKEASLQNSYNKEEQKEGTDMKTLKEFAAQLFEEEENLARGSQDTTESGLAVDDEYSEHAADVSGVDPELGDTDDVKVAQEETPLSEEMEAGTAGSVDSEPLAGSGKPEEEPWSDAEAVIDEEEQDEHVTKSMNEASPAEGEAPAAHDDVAEGHAGFGDTHEEPVAEFEVDDQELAEAVRAVRRDNIKRKLDELREASDGREVESWEDGEPERDDLLDPSEDQKELDPEAKKKVKESKNKKRLKEMGYSEEDELGVSDEMGDEDLADLVLNVDLPPEVEEELSELGVDDLDVDVDLNVGEGEEMDAGAEDEEEVEVVDDEEGVDAGSAEEDTLLTDEGSETDELGESKAKHLERKNKLLEQKLRKAAKLVEKKNQDVSSLKKQLAETNLFTSKTVYYSKFLQRALTEKALSKKALQQIVEHLDKGKTVAETKAIYSNIKRKLDEHASASRKLGGSSSKVTKPGSANLTESANQQSGEGDDGQSPSRWQVLAGIKKTD